MVPRDYPLICKPFSEERAHETRRRVTPSHVSVFLLGYPPESAPDRQIAVEREKTIRIPLLMSGRNEWGRIITLRPN